jgi:biopolymer transport protein ExbB/TolQ
MIYLAKTDSPLASIPPETVPLLILLVSLVAVTLILERSVYFFKIPKWTPAELLEIQGLLARSDWNKLKEVFLRKLPNPSASMGLSGLEAKENGRKYISQEMEAHGYFQISSMDRFLSSLATIATISPLLGVLGTVLGIVRSFAEGAGTKGAEIGISEALVTTAMGLAVAIPAYIFSNVFQKLKEDSITEMESLSSVLLPYLEEKK